MPEQLLTPAEVAAAFRVDVKTVSRWAKAGRLASIRTPGGHRRYIESEVPETKRAGEIVGRTYYRLTELGESVLKGQQQ